MTSFSVLSQSTDSVYQKNLRLFINEYYFLDSAYSSALREIKLSDSALTVQFEQIQDLKGINVRLRENINILQAKLAEQGNGIKWYVWFGSGVLTSAIIYIIIDLWKK